MQTTSGKIIIDARTIRTTPGGVSTYTEALIREVPKLLPTVPFVFLRHPDLAGPLSTNNNVTEIELGYRPHSPWTFFRMGAWLKKRFSEEDIFHAPYRILPRALHCKGLMTVHDVMHIVCPHLAFPNPWTRLFMQLFLSNAIHLSLRNADSIIAVSNYTRQDIIQVGDCKSEKIKVIPLGVDPAFRQMNTDEASELSAEIVPLKSRFFLVLGGGYPNKNHTAAIESFAKAFNADDYIELLIIQRARTLPPEIRRLLDKHVLKKRVRVIGGVSLNVLVALYNRALGLVFPSLYEGFGLPILEAMACGCPVIASNQTSVPEVAGQAALFCNPEDLQEIAEHMRRVANGPALRQELVSKGLEHAKRFKWQQTARLTVKAYQEIAAWVPTI